MPLQFIMKSLLPFRWKSVLLSACVACAISPAAPAQLQPSGGGASVRLEFPDAPVGTLLPFYETLTGKKIVRDANLAGSNLSVVSDQLLTKAQAAAFIESVLLLNGYAFVPMDETTLKLINYAGGKNVRGMGLPVITSAADLPESDSIVNYIMQLDHLSPEQAVQAFAQVVTLNPYGNITPMVNSGSIIITENTSVIRSLIKLKDHLDAPPAKVTNQFIQLKRADATNIAEIINAVLETRNGITASGTSVSGAVAAPGSTSGAGVAGSAGTGNVLVVPYRRTNSLLVIARPSEMTYIQGLIETFDKPSDGINFLKRRLEHVSVVDYLQTFYNALAMSTDIESDRKEGLQDGGAWTTSGTLNHPPSPQTAGDNSFGAGGSNGSGGTSRTADRLGEPRENGAPRSFIVGNTLLIADPNANSLIVSGSPEHLEIVEKLIGEIDQPQHQVYLSTIIGQLTLGDEFRYGLSALQTLQEFQTNGTNPVQAAGAFLNGVAASTDVTSLAETAAFPAAAGLNLYGRMSWGSTGSLNAFLRLYAQESRFRILSRPSIYAQNNAKAMISSGQRIAVPVSTLTSAGSNGAFGNQYPGSIASNIEYRDVVLKLEVIPLINSENEVTLDIAQVNDNVVGTQMIGDNEIPILNTQEFKTKITVRNGDTIVLGGLITERQEKTRTGLPVIRRIPIIGRVLGSTDRTTSREELLIFLQPHIVPTSQSPIGTNDLERNRTKLVDEALEFADPHLEPSATVRPVRPLAKP